MKSTSSPGKPRLSQRGIQVLALLFRNPAMGFSGADIARECSIASGTLYPLLYRFEQAGWLQSEWENVEPSEVGRPRRRLYRLKALGQRRASEVLQDLSGTVTKW